MNNNYDNVQIPPPNKKLHYNFKVHMTGFSFVIMTYFDE